MHLQYVLCSAFGALSSEEREILSVLLPFVSQFHLYRNTPPIYICNSLGKTLVVGVTGIFPSIEVCQKLLSAETQKKTEQCCGHHSTIIITDSNHVIDIDDSKPLSCFPYV